jgi:hypothetical protein
MMLDFQSGLIRVGKADRECALLADRHYSRQSVGNVQFMPPGKTMVLRNAEGTVVFGWLWQQKRDDGQSGYNCSIFRNESNRRSSDIIREAEQRVWREWGLERLFTYIDPSELRPAPHKFRKPKIPGKCFIAAGYKLRVRKNGRPHTSTNGLWLFVKRKGELTNV